MFFRVLVNPSHPFISDDTSVVESVNPGDNVEPINLDEKKHKKNIKKREKREITSIEEKSNGSLTLVNGKYEGEGQINFSDGSFEKGIFEEGLLNGLGKRKEKSGDIIYGTFQDGVLNGRAAITKKDGTYISLKYENGKVKEVCFITRPLQQNDESSVRSRSLSFSKPRSSSFSISFNLFSKKQ